VTCAAEEAEVPVPALKHIHDGLGRRRECPFGPYYVGADDDVYLIAVLDEGFPDLIAQRDYPAGLLLAG